MLGAAQCRRGGIEACRLLEVAPSRTAAFETTTVGVQAERAAATALVVGVERGGDLSGFDLLVRDLAALFPAS